MIRTCTINDQPGVVIAMDRNIFDAAAKNPQKPLRQPAVTKKPASSAGSVPPPKLQLHGDYGSQDPEIVAMFGRMREMRRDLEAQFEELKKKGDAQHFNVDNYLENTVNFRPSELEKSYREQKNLEEKINNLILPETCLLKVKKSKEKLTQERKGKTLGSRKKWIPMR